MPLSRPLPELINELKDLLIGDLPAALQALRDLLPENREKYNTIIVMQGQLKDANKAYFRNTIDSDDFQQRLDTIRANCMDFISALGEADFVEQAEDTGEPDGTKYGSVLYRIPRQMPLLKPVICTIRVAMEDDAIFRDIVLDKNVTVREQVEVSGMMTAELMDPAGGIFTVRSLSAAEQLVREKGYTQWIFSVTPAITGQHQLLVKVSMMEFLPDLGRYVPKEVSVLEMVTVSNEGSQSEDEADEIRRSGPVLKLGQDNQLDTDHFEAASLEMETEYAPPAPPPPVIDIPARKYVRGRAAAIMMVLILAGGTVVWALTPDYTRDWWIASIRDDADGYTVYAGKYRKVPDAGLNVEKALFLRAEKTNDLSDWRQYQTAFGDNGQFDNQVSDRIRQIESKRLASLAQAPEASGFIRFVKDFPESERLPELKTAISKNKAEEDSVLTSLEEAYLLSLQLRPNSEKISAYLRDYPAGNKLATVLKSVPKDTLKQAQSAIDLAIIRQIQQAESPAEVRKSIPALEVAGSPEAIQQAETVVSEKRNLKPALSDIRAVKERARSRKGE
ncbi:MAG: hypothetical protein ACKOZV_08520 [Bacteroidota bacterium]